MLTNNRPKSPSIVFAFALVVLGIVLGCTTTDLVNNLRQRRLGMLISPPTATRRRPTPTRTEVALLESANNTATDTPEPSDTETLAPTDTPVPSDTPIPSDTSTPADTATPRPTRTKAPPTAIPPPSHTFAPAPSPEPTRCPDEYCIVKAVCNPGHDTRAIGTVYENGVPVNDVRVVVSYDNGGPAEFQFLSGHDPINPSKLDPKHPGYYQIGMKEGSPFDANWWVFLVDGDGSQISEGQYFKTTDVQTGNSCQIQTTDFAK